MDSLTALRNDGLGVLPSFAALNMAECDCLPPPQFDLPAPPDPSLIWKLDAFAQAQLDQLAVECDADDFVNVVPVELVPRLGTSPPSSSSSDNVGEYFVFVATAIAVMLIATLVAILIVLRLKRLNRSSSASPQKHARMPMTPKSTSSGSSSGGSHGSAGDNVRAANPLGSTNWSYNSMRPVPTHDKPQMQQATSLGMLMYGGVEQPTIRAYPTPMSSRTLPKRPRPMQIPLTKSVPSHLQRPPAPLHITDDDDLDHPYCSASVANRVYEEIPARRIGEDTVFVELMTSRPLPPQRRPPPVHRPPPPPATEEESGPESPCSCQSLSHCSSSIDGELEHIHLTPSPKRPSSDDTSHAAAYGKSAAPSEENFFSEMPPNGRESGYGTDGRPSRLWDSPGAQARTRKQMLVRDDRKGPPPLAVYGQQHQNGHAMTYV